MDRVLPFITKPGRYIGGEVNAAKKDLGGIRLRFALAFPDIYEIGMSHLGIQILYHILNSRPDTWAERVFAPWPDLEAQLRRNGFPLVTLESKSPLRHFDAVGFSLQYELAFTNVLAMLELGGIPLRSAARRQGDPIVIAGGPGVFNPAPVSPFFDVFAIGEGEEVVTEIAQTILDSKRNGLARNRTLERLAGLKGLYVPVVHGQKHAVEKRTVRDLNDWPLPSNMVIPSIRTIHDRINLEIARGCTRGCRFCQAGMVWRPVRERNPEFLKQLAADAIGSTGYDEISLLSLSTGDYSHIESLISDMMDSYCDRRIAISLPSLRVETLGPNLIEQIRRVRKTSFTLAPEAGTEELRRRINKGNTEKDLIVTAEKVFSAGWRSLKLYFMIGLPGEEQKDLDGIIDLASTLVERSKKKQVTLSISTFVPKPHTPFQWERQISREETREKQNYLKERVRRRQHALKWQDPGISLLEGIFSRGGAELAPALEKAFKLGCRFDGWTEQLRVELWNRALGESGINADSYLGPREEDAAFPWDHIDTGIRREFLVAERDKSFRGELTPDCRNNGCSDCGVCTADICNVPARNGARDSSARANPLPGSRKKYRLKFTKQGDSRYLSHLDLMNILIRGLNRGGAELCYSEGFHPQPLVSFFHALPVGVESLCEYADMAVRNDVPDKGSFISAVNSGLPEGIRVLEAEEITPGTESKPPEIFQYEFTFPAGSPGTDSLQGEIEYFTGRNEFVVKRTVKGVEKRRDIRPLVKSVFLNGTQAIRAELRIGVKPSEVLIDILGINPEASCNVRIIKTGTIWRGQE